MGDIPVPTPHRFAIRLASIDDLFVPLDARPLAERSLNEDVRLHLLDEWERIRATPPATLDVHAPASERSQTNEHAVTTAVHADLRSHTRGLRQAEPLSHRDKVAAWIGVIVFLLSIAVSTTLDQLSSDVIIAGISQGIVVVGWVALWVPAQRVAVDILPHHFARKRYAEFADIELRYVWTGAVRPPAPAVATVTRPDMSTETTV